MVKDDSAVGNADFPTHVEEERERQRRDRRQDGVAYVVAQVGQRLDQPHPRIGKLERVGQQREVAMNDEEVERSGVDLELMTCVAGIGAVLQSETPMTELNELKQMMENF